MAVRGVFNSDAGIQGERMGDFAGSLLRINPTGAAPMLALSSGMKSADATDVVVTWFEEAHISGRTVSTAAYDADDTPIVLADASSYPPGSTLLVEATGELLLVTAVAGNSVSVVRGLAGTTAGNIANGGGIQRIGNAVEEGSQRPVAIASQGYPKINYCQIFRNAWSITGTAKAVRFYTGGKDAKNRQDCAAFHAEDIERSLIWGRMVHGVQNGAPFRLMDGLNAQIKTINAAAGATTSMDDLDLFFQKVFSKNIKGAPNERIAYCGNKALAIFNSIARLESTTFISPGEEMFGLNISKWLTPYGTVKLMTHPLMNESPVWTKDLYVYHPAAIRTRYLRRTFVDNDDMSGSRGGVDADNGVLTTELSVEYQAEVTGGILTGLTQAVANT